MKKDKKSTMEKAAHKMFKGGMMSEEQEAVLTPIQMVFFSFIKDKIAMAGVSCFVFIFICCIILPVFFPIDMYYQDVTQSNVAPGFGMLKAPASLKNDAGQVSIGSTFSVGVDTKGHVYEWGQFPTDKLKKLPKGMGKLTQVSAGLDHILAVDENGGVLTWGNDRMGLGAIPVELRMGEKAAKIYAGYQMSLVLTDKGRLYSWGNSYIVDIKFPEGVQGHIKTFDANNDIVIVLTDAGDVVPLTKKTTAYSAIPGGGEWARSRHGCFGRERCGCHGRWQSLRMGK